MTQASYHIPKNTVLYEETIKNSRFLVHIAHTPDVDRARNFITDIKTKYADATHNCWAYVAGAPDDSRIFGFSDDGEPNGTAGKPILNVLMGSGVGEITAVVTRYFGGIKLGTGGLARAYGGSVNKAFHLLVTDEKIIEVIVSGISEYSQQGQIEQILKNYKMLSVEKEFGEKVKWTLKLDSREVEQVVGDVFDKTSGRVSFEIED